MTHSGNSPDAGREERPSDSTSSSLLDLARQGDADGWQRLVDLYTPLVRWWCWRQGVGEEDIKDRVQEVFTVALQRITEFKREHVGAFRGWLRQITHHKISDLRRAERGNPQAAGGSEAQEMLANVPTVAAADSSAPDDASERMILLHRAMELVRDKFEPRTWQAAWRTAAEEQPVDVVATDLGMTEGAVRTAKSKVLAEFRKVLEEIGE